jgi:glycosyltransferase involved in cell wall biosynthesis
VFSDIARWGRLKNTTTLLQAFAEVRRVIPGARLILFGGGLGHGGAAQKWAQSKRLDAGVAFHGPLPYETLMRKLGGECDFLVHLSRIETFCNAVLEALAFDVPVIAGNVGGIAWAADPVPVTFIRDVTDPAEAAAAMLQLARDPAAGRPRHWSAILERRYAPARIAELSESIYASICNPPAPAV